MTSLRQAARGLARQPGFTAIALLTLGLGIGATATVFSVVDAVLLSPLPYREVDRVVVLLGQGTDPVSPANVVEWRAEATSFSGIGAAELWSTTLAGVDRPERLAGTRVTPDLFPLLGATPARGRLFRPDEESSAARVVILSDRLWRRAFGADPAIVGRSIRLSGEGYQVVGVMGPEFIFPPFWAGSSDFWAPLPLAERASSRGQSLRAFARLAPAASLGQARAEVAAITGRLERESPGTNTDIRVVPLEERVVGGVRGALVVLFAAVGFVLLIACANVAHLLLVRGQARRRELAVRAALGASRGAVTRTLLLESGLLAAGGAVLGLAIAWLGVRAVVALGPATIPRLGSVTIDGPVLGFTMAIALGTVMVFGLGPALLATRLDLASVLGEVGKGGTGGTRESRLRGLLIASEFAMAMVLLAGAGLAIRSFLARTAIDPGFDPSGVTTMVVSVAGANAAAPERRATFYRELVERIEALPAVERASMINHLPLAGDIWRWGYLPEGEPRPAPGTEPRGAFRVVLPGYFAALGLPLVAGRDFGPDDVLGRPGVVIVNRALAERHWPGADPIGRRLNLGSVEEPSWATVIGVSDNAVLDDWTRAPGPELYLPLLQVRLYLERPSAAFSYLTLVVRTAGDPATLTEPIRRIVAELDRDVPVAEVATMAQVVARANATPRFYLTLLAAFAAVALALAAVGIYGVTSYAVARRTRELGIRMALGAARPAILALVARQSLVLAGIGTAVGLAASLLVTRFMTGILFRTSPLDPVTFGLTPAVLAIVALGAALVPAVRAARIDPAGAVRE